MKNRQRCLYIFLFTILNNLLPAQQDHTIQDEQEFFLYDDMPDEVYPLVDMDQILIIEDTIDDFNDNFTLIENDTPTHSDQDCITCITIPLDNECLKAACHNGLLIATDCCNNLQETMVQDTKEAENVEDDEIVPVPHELINSVKKANKEKKKLEKLEKNKRKKILKREKRKHHE